MIYLDTNVIIYAIENHPKYGKKCKKILEDIESEKIKASCSVLVLAEAINVLTKLNKALKGKTLDIRKNIDAILSLPIMWIDMNFAVIRRASEYSYAISGIDYIHIATMEMNSITSILSADEDFDKAEFIKRMEPLKYE